MRLQHPETPILGLCPSNQHASTADNQEVSTRERVLSKTGSEVEKVEAVPEKNPAKAGFDTSWKRESPILARMQQ